MLKKMIMEDPTLKYYDVMKPVTLQTDASQNGLGSVILQDNMPVAYASKILSPAQRNYAERDRVRNVSNCFWCWQISPVTVCKRSDCWDRSQAVEAICKNPLTSALPILQWFLLQLQHFDLKVMHKPGKEMYVSDALLWAFLEIDDGVSEGEVQAQVDMVIATTMYSHECKKDRCLRWKILKWRHWRR